MSNSFNPHRGEVEFKLDGLTFTARPTFKLIAAIEQECGASILLLSGKIRAAAMHFHEAVRIAVLAARHSDTPPAGAEKDEFLETVFQLGPINLLLPISQLLGAAVSTGQKEKKGGGAAQSKPASSPGTNTKN